MPLYAILYLFMEMTGNTALDYNENSASVKHVHDFGFSLYLFQKNQHKDEWINLNECYEKQKLGKM